MPEPRSPLPYSLRLGVTGHRALKNEPAVAQATRGLLDRIEKTLNQKADTPISWTIVSPLAKGADRIVAEAVLGQADSHLEVVTPLPLDEYRKDFVEPADVIGFSAMLARAKRVEEPHYPFEPGPTTQEQKAARDQAYLRVGQRVVDTSEILIAVWDGKSGSGTGDTVRYALTQGRPVLWINAEKPDAPITRVTAVTVVEVMTEGFPGTAKQLSPGYHQQVAYCRDKLLKPENLDRLVKEEAQRLLDAARDAGLPLNTLQPVMEHIVPEYVRADELAKRYQLNHTDAMQRVLYMGAAAFTVALMQVLFVPAHRELIGVDLAFTASLLLLWRRNRREAWHGKWLNDRCLAEHLRVTLFASLVGPIAPVIEARDLLPFYRGPSHWITNYTDTLMSRASHSQSPAEQLGSLKAFLLKNWIEDQREFNRRTAEKKSKATRNRHNLQLWMLGATVLMAILHVFGVGADTAPYSWHRILRPDVWIEFLALVLLPWAGAVHAVTGQLELERVAERSRRMVRNLDRLIPRFRGAATMAQLAEVTREAADLMIHENHEWWVLLSFQEARLHA